MKEEDRDQMPDTQSEVDEGLVAMFIRMSPEERLRANDNMRRMILELRDAYKRQRTDTYGPDEHH
jgi:hypothetical protein